MKSTDNHRGPASSMFFMFCMLLCYNSTSAAPAEPPLAKASDIEFTVKYSTDKLMLGDILFAQVTIRNESEHAVRVSDFHPLVIRAKTPKATQLAWGFGAYPNGTKLLELVPGEEIVFGVVLDVFRDDGREDGTFDPFDSELLGQELGLHATCSTLLPSRIRDLDLDDHDYLMQHTQVIEFSRPVISRQEFDDAVTEVLRGDDLELLSFSLPTGQLSYLFTKTSDLRGYTGDPRTHAAIINILSERLPKESSARRAASIILAVGRFVKAESAPAEDAAISSVLALLDECPRIEKAYWAREIIKRVSYEPMQRLGHISERKAELLVSRIRDAGS